MKTQKQNYLSPVTETLVVRFEGGICQTSPWNDSVNNVSNDYDDDYNLGEI